MYLSNDDTVFPSFLLHLLIEMFLERKPILSPHLFFPSFSCIFYQYGLMDIYFILWVIYYYHCLLCYSGCSTFGHWEIFQVDFFFFQNSSVLF